MAAPDRKRPKRATEADKAAFLDLIREGHTAASAARGLGFNPTTFTKKTGRNIQAVDEEFAEAYQEAIEHSTQLLEREAIRRAAEGWDEAHVTNKGEIYVIRKYSDVLLMFLLKARRPETYRDNHKIEHTGPNGTPLEVKFSFKPDEGLVDEQRER